MKPNSLDTLTELFFLTKCNRGPSPPLPPTVHTSDAGPVNVRNDNKTHLVEQN